MLEYIQPEERDSILLGYKYSIDRSWFIDNLSGSGHSFSLPVYLADVVPNKRILYIKYLSELFGIFDKYNLNENNSYLGWYVVHPNSPYIWDFFDVANRDERIESCSEIK